MMKTMTLYRPHAIQNALSDFDRYFESFFGESLLPPAARIFNHLPAVDIQETEKSYVLDMELPGFDEKDIEIHIDGNSLSIASKQEETREAKDGGESKGTWLLHERRESSFSRSFKLPENANPEEVTAQFKNGILSLEIVKRAEAQKRSIQINVK
jgi:HSP20 family protein